MIKSWKEYEELSRRTNRRKQQMLHKRKKRSEVICQVLGSAILLMGTCSAIESAPEFIQDSIQGASPTKHDITTQIASTDATEINLEKTESLLINQENISDKLSPSISRWHRLIMEQQEWHKSCAKILEERVKKGSGESDEWDKGAEEPIEVTWHNPMQDFFAESKRPDEPQSYNYGGRTGYYGSTSHWDKSIERPKAIDHKEAERKEAERKEYQTKKQKLQELLDNNNKITNQLSEIINLYKDLIGLQNLLESSENKPIIDVDTVYKNRLDICKEIITDLIDKYSVQTLNNLIGEDIDVNSQSNKLSLLEFLNDSLPKFDMLTTKNEESNPDKLEIFMGNLTKDLSQVIGGDSMSSEFNLLELYKRYVLDDNSKFLEHFDLTKNDIFLKIYEIQEIYPENSRNDKLTEEFYFFLNQTIETDDDIPFMKNILASILKNGDKFMADFMESMDALNVDINLLEGRLN